MLTINVLVILVKNAETHLLVYLYDNYGEKNMKKYKKYYLNDILSMCDSKNEKIND